MQRTKEQWQSYMENRERVFEIQDYKCANFNVCGNPVDNAHHIIPRREGGGDQKGNIIGLCFPCHDLTEKLIQEADTPIPFFTVPRKEKPKVRLFELVEAMNGR